MGAVVRTLIGLTLLALGACSGGDDTGLGAVPVEAGTRDAALRDAEARPDVANTPVGPNVGGPCTTASDCGGPDQPSCLQAIDPGSTVEGARLWAADLLGTPLDDGGTLPPVPDLEVAAAGGYCSGGCVNDGDCGPGAVCFGLAPLIELLGGVPDGGMPGGFFSDSGLCLQPCDRDDDCRTAEGYVCRDALEGAPPLFEPFPGLPAPVGPSHCLPPAPVE